MRKVLLSRRTKRAVVGSPHCKAQIAIRPAEHFVCVIVVLPIVFPEAHSADFIAAAFAKRFEAAARTSKRKVTDRSHAV